MRLSLSFLTTPSLVLVLTHLFLLGMDSRKCLTPVSLLHLCECALFSAPGLDFVQMCKCAVFTAPGLDFVFVFILPFSLVTVSDWRGRWGRTPFLICIHGHPQKHPIVPWSCKWTPLEVANSLPTTSRMGPPSPESSSSRERHHLHTSSL